MSIKKHLSKPNPLKTLIVGGGLMGAGDDSNFYSHAHAIQESLEYELYGIIETCPQRRDWIMGKWQKPVFRSQQELSTTSSIDVVIICTSDGAHFGQLKSALELEPKLVICEKPLTTLPQQSLEIMALYKSKKVPLILNYSRRFLSVYSDIKNHIEEKGHISTVIKYAKGLKHNGVHALDLIEWFYGDITSYQCLHEMRDHCDDDPTLTLSLQTDRCSNLILQGLSEKYYTHFEVDIFTKKSRYRIFEDHSKMEIYRVKDGQGLPQGKRLVLDEIVPINHAKALDQLLKVGLQAIYRNHSWEEDLLFRIKIEGKAHNMALGIELGKKDERILEGI